MKRLCLILLAVIASLLPLAAQQMGVTGFTRLRRPLFNPEAVAVDKANALMDFETYEKGFEFLAGGKVPVAADEGDGLISLTLPHNTSYLTVTHPVFGKLVWKVPDGKRLKKGKHYRAVLLAGDPAKEYKAPNQWVVFHLNPGNLILQVDSVARQVRKDAVEFYLPLGEHSYRAEAPFFEPVEGTFCLTDEGREEISVNLQPFYSFLSVKSAQRGGDIFIDNTRVSGEDATSYRIGEGHHRVAVFFGEECLYDSLVFVGRAEKKVLEISAVDLYPRDLRRTSPVYINPPVTVQGGEERVDAAPQGAPVKISSADPGAEIWVDRERVGTGCWEGFLTPGFHLAQTVMGGVESAATTLWVEDGFPQEFTLRARGTVYGVLNIHSNVPGARIDISGSDFGEAPTMVNIDASYCYDVTLSKKGYKSRTVSVFPRGNNIVDVYVELKKGRK